MAKFCTYCGKKLEEGEICDCPQSQQARETATQPQPEQQSAAPKAPSVFGTELKNTLLSYITTPRKSVKGLLECKNSLGIAGIFVGVNFFVMFFYWLTNVAYTWKGADISMPVGQILLGSFVMTILVFGLSAAALFCVAKLNKHPLTIQQSFAITSASSIFPTVIMLVCMLLGLISTELQSVVMQLVVIFWIVNAYADYREYAGLSANASIKNLAIFCGVLFVIYVICYLIAGAFSDWCTNSILKAALGDFGDYFDDIGSIGDLIDMLR